MNDLVNLGYKQPLQETDSFEARSDMKSEVVYNEFAANWEEEVKIHKLNPEKKSDEKSDGKTKKSKHQGPSLARALRKTFGREFFLAGLLRIVSDSLPLVNPFLLEKLIIFIVQSNTSDAPPVWEGYVYAVAILLCSLIPSLCLNYHFHMTFNIGVKVRIALTAAIYRKTLKLSPSARSSMTSGQLVNLMSTDAGKFEMLTGYLHYVWFSLLQTIAIIYLTIRALGATALIGIGVLLCSFPFQGKIMKRLNNLRKETVQYTDSRLKVMNEILQGIRILKFYAWENSFFKKVADIRNQEVKVIKWSMYLRAGNGVVMSVAPVLMSLATFIVLGATDTLRPEKIFATIVYFGLLRFPLIMLPLVIGMLVDGAVALGRIQTLLLAQELEQTPMIINSSEFAIKIENADFAWDVSEQKKNGTSTPAPTSTSPAAETGDSQSKSDTNTPKSSLNANTPIDTRTSVTFSNRASMASGSPDIAVNSAMKSDANQSATPSRTPRGSIVKASAIGGLQEVNLVIPKDSLTCIVGAVGSGKTSLLCGMLGEMKRTKGDVLIAGTVGYCPQQAWVQNASLRNNITFGLPFEEEKYHKILHVCALEPDLKVLPDGDMTEIGEKGINVSGGQKQRINLARALYFNADTILLDDPLSAVDAHVSKYLFHECINGYLQHKTRVLVTHQLQYLPFADFVVVLKDGRIVEQGSYAELLKVDGEFAYLMKNFGGIKNDDESDTKTKKVERKTTEKKKDKVDDEKKERERPRELMSAEERVTGGVALSVYLFYFYATGGIFVLLTMLFSATSAQVSRIMMDYWLAQWSVSAYNFSKDVYIIVFVALGVAYCILSAIYNLMTAYGGTNAALELHERSFKNILRAPSSFFDTTPIGRILNRFSKDQDNIDSLLMESLRMYMMMLFIAAGILGTIAAITPIFLVPLVPCLLYYYYAQAYYRSTSRELKRIESILRSPLYAHFSETLTGLPSIRAYREQQRFITDNAKRIDAAIRPYFCQLASQRWVGVRIESAGAFIVFFASLVGVVAKDTISPGLAALSISYAMQVTGVMTWLVRQAVDAENYMNSVERAKFYVDNLPSEKPYEIPEKAPAKDWPQEGIIDIKDLVLRYREGLPTVLNGISLRIKKREKIGVVGRTGAGKSSLMLALFRLVEPESGTITIDGVDITQIGLRDLRSRLAIIPQDPVLYSGTVRFNLDPFGNYKDDQIWTVLERSQLKIHVSSLPQQLETPIVENGENFSLGQRCQMCLARAMLRNARVIVLDEATASVDMETDAAIQKSIREDFSASTILTIAHRLNTIIDYDRVLVLSFGRIVEFDSPAILLRNPSSLFSSMVNETGVETAAFLRNMAEQAYIRKTSNQ